jgi:hypothetical protein
MALLSAQLAEIDRQAREVRRAAERAERESIEREEREISVWYAEIEALANGAMVAAGYHEHRGQWRSGRNGGDQRNDRTDAPPESISREEVAGLLKRAESGDKTCLPRLQEVLLAEADGRRHGGLLESDGSSQQWLRSVLVDSTSGRDLITKEATRTKVDQLRRELEGLNPTPVECSLAEPAAFCWFLVYKYKFIFESANELTIRQAEYQQRRIDAAHPERRPRTRRAQPSDAPSLFARISVGASVAPHPIHRARGEG